MSCACYFIVILHQIVLNYFAPGRSTELSFQSGISSCSWKEGILIFCSSWSGKGGCWSTVVCQGLFQLMEELVVIRCRRSDIQIVQVVVCSHLHYYDIKHIQV